MSRLCVHNVHTLIQQIVVYTILHQRLDTYINAWYECCLQIPHTYLIIVVYTIFVSTIRNISNHITCYECCLQRPHTYSINCSLYAETWRRGDVMACCIFGFTWTDDAKYMRLWGHFQMLFLERKLFDWIQFALKCVPSIENKSVWLHGIGWSWIGN